MPAVNTFAGAVIDRAATRRTDPAWVAERRADPAARALAVSSEGPFVDCSGDPCRPALFPLAALDAGPDPPVLLGLDADGPLFAVYVGAGGSQPPGLGGARSAMSLRDSGAR